MKFTEQQITDLLVTALEGGSNYWYFIELSGKVESFAKESISEMVTRNVLKRDRSFIIREDDENGEVLGELSKTNIERGIKLLEKDYPVYYSDVLTEDYDAESADIFFQLVVMGEVVYG